MRTRCPACGSVFRVTREQVGMKGGKVRCGHCHEVFNALDNLLEEPEASGALRSSSVATDPSQPAAASPAPESRVERLPDPSSGQAAQPGATQAAIGPGPAARPVGGERTEAPLESARDAGLVAARELSETPGFNRWAAGTMATDGSLGLDLPYRSRRHAWLRVLLVLLVFGLLAQIIYYFRSDIVAYEPRVAPLFATLLIDVPRPAHGDLIAVERTESQSSHDGRGLLLAVTLKNRASYVQAWPMLELTLLDANDQLLARRVFSPAEYLAAAHVEAGFPAHGEVATQLLLDTGDMPAAVYRLDAFYP